MKRTRTYSRRPWQGLDSLELRQLLTSSVTVAIGALPADIPTGSTIKVPVTVTNNLPGKVSGPATIVLTLNDGVHGDVTLTTKTTTLSIISGGHTDLLISVTIPANTALQAPTLTANATIGANTAISPVANPNITWDFGNLAGEGNMTLTAVDPKTGNTGTFKLTGPGSGALTVSNGLWNMSLTGTTRATKVTVSGAIDLQQIRATTMVGAIDASQADFTAATGFESNSSMNFGGGILALSMHDVSTLAAAGHAITIGAGDFKGDALLLKFNKVNDLAVSSMMPISSFTAASVASHVGNPEIYSTAYFGKIAIAGNFTGVTSTSFPEFYADGADPASGMGIASISVGGNMNYSEFYSDYGDIGPVKIGGFMDNSAEVYAEYGAIGNVQVGGKMDHRSEIYSEYGGIGTVKIGGNMDNSSYIEVGDQGNIGAVTIGGNLDHSSEVYISDHGNIASVTVKGNVDNSARIECDDLGNIGPVTITGNLDHSAEIYVDEGNIAAVSIGGNLDNSAEVYADYGNISPVTIGGNLDNSAEVYADYGDIARVTIGGNLDNSAEVYASEGNIGDVKIGKNFDHSAEVYSDDGSIGVGNVTVGGNFSNGAEVYAYGAAVKSVKVAGDSIGTSGNTAQVHAYASIGSISIGGKSVYGDFEAGRSIGTVKVGGIMQNGLVKCYQGGHISQVSVGQLDASTIVIGATTGVPAGTRADFHTQNSSIGQLTITGIKTAGVTTYITNNSKILAWNIGTLACGGPSTGASGLVEFHVATISNLPTGVTKTLVA
jgi:hypothetical protein